MKLWHKVMVFSISFFSAVCYAAQQPTIETGARVFLERCTLCHGNQGTGDGLIPLTIKSYPNTNLFDVKHGADEDSVRRAVLYGGTNGKMNDEMPPWSDELTWEEVESVIKFTVYLRSNQEKAIDILSKQSVKKIPSSKLGKVVFNSRCALCHGVTGEGNGKMAKVIKNPPPYNLTASTVPAEYLKLIITRGGEEIGRSSRMPPWGKELTPHEIDSVIEYILSLRVTKK